MRKALLALAGLSSVGAGLVLAAAVQWALAGVALGIGALILAGVALRGRRGVAALGAAAAIATALVALRVATVEAGWLVCENERCSRGGPWWSRVLPEPACLQVGLVLTRLARITTAAESESYARAFAAPFRAGGDPPNALVLFSTASTLRRLVLEPPGTDTRPCIVFLHGFGGLSSSYLMAMRDPLPEVIVVAPALDVAARWDGALGHSVVERTLASLPARADRRRLYLVGLSNGAILGARYAGLFRGALLLSGVGETAGGRVRVISGAADRRIPAGDVRRAVSELRARGVDASAELVDGADHGLVLTHAALWTERLARLLAQD
jgi:predicted esterase